MTVDTLPSIHSQPRLTRAANPAQGADPRTAAAGIAAIILATDPGLVQALSEEAANRQRSGGQGGDGRTGPAPVVDIPAPAKQMEEAQQTLAGIVDRLPLLLLGPAALRDPMQTEEGAPIRGAEGVATQMQATARTDGPGAVDGAMEATGIDADIAADSPNVGAFFKFSQFVNLLIALRDILLQFEAIELKNSAEMSTMRLKTAIYAGEMQKQAAVENFGAAIAGGLGGLAIGAASMKKTYESTSMQTGTSKRNLTEANKSGAVASSSHGGTRHHAAPSSDLRPARNLDDSPLPTAKGNERVPADLQPDAEANVTVMNQSAKKTGLSEVDRTDQAWHGSAMAKSQKTLSQATLLNSMLPAVTGTIQAGGNIQSQSTTVVGDIAKQEADILASVAKTHQENVSNNRALRDATAQLFISLLALENGTNEHIIQRA